MINYTQVCNIRLVCTSRGTSNRLTVIIASSPSKSSPAVFQAGENVTLTCSITNNPTLSWTSTFSNADGKGVNPSNSAITGIFLHGHNTGNHTCSGGSKSASYVLTVTGKEIYNSR